MALHARDGGEGAAGTRVASLAWVETADGLVPVSTYAHLPPAQRPHARCPICQRQVVLKLGSKVVHHAAHSPHDECVVTQSETALHFNLKCHVAAELERAAADGRPLRVAIGCRVGRPEFCADEDDDTDPPDEYEGFEAWWEPPCPARHERVWIQRWDRVVLERRIGDERAARIPDIVVYLGDVVVGAIEVFHSHAVDAAKATALATLGVPWVEVRADATLLAPDTAWTLDAPLPAHRVGPAVPWLCARHKKARAAALVEEAAEREAAREAARHTWRVCAVKLVDVLYPNGKSYRHVYRVVEYRLDGQPLRMSLERGDEVLLDLALDSAPERVLSARLAARMKRDRQEMETHRGALTDSPMQWARGRLAERMAHEVEHGRWRRMPLEPTHPRRWRFAPRTGKWFQPEDLRDIDWTRPEDDDLQTPHAAWNRQRMAGRPSVGSGEMGDHAERRVDPPLLSPTSVSARPLAPSDGRVSPPAPITSGDLGACVRAVHAHPAVAALCELWVPARAGRAAVILVPEAGASPEAIRALDREVAASAARLWLGRPEEWTRTLGDVPWLPALSGASGDAGVSLQRLWLPLPLLAAWFAEGVAELESHHVLAARRAESLPA